ncbi:putative serine/threonine-protein kinase PIX13, partial [Mucuna pruriens]
VSNSARESKNALGSVEGISEEIRIIESTSVNGGSNSVFPSVEMPKLKEFNFADLKSATKSFRSEALLGEGGFGKVYKGWLHEKTLTPTKPGSGITVAIKKLNPESMQGLQEWQSEINFLGRISHPNLVKLLGYCCDDMEFLLVYEFMPKGSLESHLFRKNTNVEPMSWDTRLKIAIGAARGLTFLHTSEKQIIYRDFKASNILLDEDYNAKISDFGLTKLGPSGGDSHVSTRIMGTHGYAAPEYIATGHLYVESDVYGFGVVLLEMMTGMRALDKNRLTGQENLVEWKKPSLSDKRKLKSIMDERIEGQYSTKAAFRAAQLTLKCLEPNPKKRPPMKNVLETLQRIEAIKCRKKECKRCCTKFSTMNNFHSVNGGSNNSNSSVFLSVEMRNLKEFNFADLKAATKSFRSNALLGEGGFGKVYKGWLHEKTLTPTKPGSGMVVAVKKLNPESFQGFREWQSEINFLGRISHPNLVKLLGYCCDDVEFLLVYEFMPKGSLESHLFRRNTNTEPLSWDTRLKIAIGAARGLAFLHTSEKQIIYRDFKASNILLDEDYNAKISDFGLAKLGPSGGDSHVTTRIIGTHGYAAPEYISTVLLEMLTGLRALDINRSTEQQNLVEWVKPSLSDKRKLKSIMDERIEGQYPTKAALKAAQLTLKCLEHDHNKRPPMKDVLETLECIKAIKDRRKESSVQKKSNLTSTINSYALGMLLLTLAIIPFEGSCGSHQRRLRRPRHESLHFSLFQHETINKTGYVIVNGVEGGKGTTDTSIPFGTVFVFQDPLTANANRSSKQLGTAEGTSITSSLDGLSSISVAKLTLRLENRKGSIFIVGSTNNIERSDHPVVGGTEDFLFVQGYITSSPVDLKGPT